MTAPSPWRFLFGGGANRDSPASPADGPTNMAIDAALLSAVGDGAPPVLRLYRWNPPTLSFGRNQPAAGLYDEAAARARGIAFVRRPTGGQAVLHADELTYAVAAPVAVIGRPRAAYRRINEALVAGLRRLGLEASVAGAPVVTAGPEAGADGSGPDWSRACFRSPAEGEVVVSGRKLVGSAQRVESRTILQHGSILLGGSQAAAEELLREQPANVDVTGEDEHPVAGAGWTTVDAELGRRPGMESAVESLRAGFESVLGIQLAGSTLSTDEQQLVERCMSRFTSPEWTWRR